MRSDIEFIRHIINEIEFLLARSKGMNEEEFLSDDLKQRAFSRSLEIIGEAVKQLSTEFVLKNPQVEWRSLAGMRDKLIHGYFSIDYQIVWNVVTQKIPELRTKLAPLAAFPR